MIVQQFMNDILMIREWKRGQFITWKCHGCGKDVHFLFEHENNEDTLYNKFVKCESCNHEFQLIF